MFSSLTTVIVLAAHVHLWQALVIPPGEGEPKDLNMNVSERIQHWGYPSVREYTVTTDDGYMIYVQRIQNKRFKQFNDSVSKPVVFLQHGLMSSSSCWVINLPGQSLAYMLADAGYDVWLGNVRGNTYGRRHVTLNVNDRKFWNFTWTDMAAHDLPAMIEFVLTTSGQKKIATYVGHSQGTTIAFAHFSAHPAYALAKVNTFIALAPVTTVGKITAPLAKLAPFVTQIKVGLALFGDYSLGSLQWILKFVKPICLRNTAYLPKCEHVYFSIMGTDQFNYVNQSRMPIVIKQFPDGTSIKNVAHFAQMVNSDKFEEYNYGVWNYAKYKKLRPPTFDVSRLPIPTQLFYSTKDQLADAADIEANLLPRLTHLTKVVKSNDFQHSDYIIALTATTHVYDEVLLTVAKVINNGI